MDKLHNSHDDLDPRSPEEKLSQLTQRVSQIETVAIDLRDFAGQLESGGRTPDTSGMSNEERAAVYEFWTDERNYDNRRRETVSVSCFRWNAFQTLVRWSAVAFMVFQVV